MKPKVGIACVLGVLVIIVGIYVTIKLIQWCQAHLPPPEPDPPAQVTNGVTSAYSVVGVGGSVRTLALPSPESAESAPATTSTCDCGCNFTLQVGIVQGVPVILKGYRPDLIDHAAFVQQFAALGFSEFASSNNAPGVISFNGSAVTVAGDGTVSLTIESSSDMQAWSPVQAATIPAGMTLDLSLSGQPCTNNVFYRVRAE